MGEISTGTLVPVSAGPGPHRRPDGAAQGRPLRQRVARLARAAALLLSLARARSFKDSAGRALLFLSLYPFASTAAAAAAFFPFYVLSRARAAGEKSAAPLDFPPPPPLLSPLVLRALPLKSLFLFLAPRRFVTRLLRNARERAPRVRGPLAALAHTQLTGTLVSWCCSYWYPRRGHSFEFRTGTRWTGVGSSAAVAGARALSVYLGETGAVWRPASGGIEF